LAQTPRKRSAQARISEPGRRRQRWKPEWGETRVARFDAQHDSAAGRTYWPATLTDVSNKTARENNHASKKNAMSCFNF
jgi:hypothetical protein